MKLQNQYEKGLILRFDDVMAILHSGLWKLHVPESTILKKFSYK